MIPADAFRIAAASILLTLGVAILLRPGRPLSAAAFGVFAIGLAALYLGVAFDMPRRGALDLVANIVIMVGFWSMFLVFPRPLARHEVPLLALAFAVGFAGSAVGAVPPLLNTAAAGDVGALAGSAFGLLSGTGVLAGVVLFPLRAWRLAAGETSTARALAIFSIGVALFRGFDAADVPAAARGEVPLSAVLHAGLVLALPAVLWILVILRGAHPRLARNTVLAHAVVVLLALYLVQVGVSPSALGLAGALLLGFAVLRGQIEGLELKVRFAVSRSTVAAVFIAVFFVASEGAQQYFGDTTGSQYLGIAAAGALVFIIAPLQRAAEGLAAKAVPMGASAPRLSTREGDASSERDYREAVRLAVRDQALTREQERSLLRLARRAGIDPARALDIHDEVEQEIAHG